MPEFVWRYIKVGIALGLLWAALFSVSRVGCRQAPGREMDPAVVPQSTRVIYPARYRPGEDVTYDEIVFYEYEGAEPGRLAFAGRVIGLPGDRIRIEKGEVFRNDQPVNQTYVAAANRSDETREELVVPRGCFYILADNRSGGAKADSRALGPIGMHAVIGEVRP